MAGCPRCASRRFWTLKDGRRRCVQCRFDWRPDRLPLRLTRRQWHALLEWFVRGMTSAQIAHETRLERKRILRALTVVRAAMAESAPEGVRAASMSRRVHHEEAQDHPAAHVLAGRPQPPVLGLRLAGEDVWAEVVSPGDADAIVRSLRDRKGGRAVPEATLRGYAAVVYRSRLYRLAEGEGRLSAPFGHLEGFWAYLHHRLRSKGGVRRSRLGLYLAEYAWRYNHRKLAPREQIRELMKLLGRGTGVRTTTIARS